jgi:hypothetical protein
MHHITVTGLIFPRNLVSVLVYCLYPENVENISFRSINRSTTMGLKQTSTSEMTSPQDSSIVTSMDRMRVYHFHNEDRPRGHAEGDVARKILVDGQIFGRLEVTARGPIFALTEYKALGLNSTVISYCALNEEFRGMKGTRFDKLDRYTLQWVLNVDGGVLDVDLIRDRDTRCQTTWNPRITFEAALKECGVRVPSSPTRYVDRISAGTLYPDVESRGSALAVDGATCGISRNCRS